MKEQLIALKQLAPFGSRLLCSYLIFGKPMAIRAAKALGFDQQACSAHGTYLVARNGANGIAAKNESWFRSMLNNALRTCVGCSTMFFRQAYEGIGRIIGDDIDKQANQNPSVKQMLAILSAHSPETSMAEYALPEDAFRGISPADKASWAAVGAAFNSAVFHDVEASYADYAQAEPDVEDVLEAAPQGDCNCVRVFALVTDNRAVGFQWPAGIPRGRPIQVETLRSMVSLLNVDADTGACPCPCITVVQPPGTGAATALVLQPLPPPF
jgi:hypothetical protein